MIITIVADFDVAVVADVDGTRTTCLLEIHGFLRWCQASAHFVLRIRCQMVRGTIGDNDQ